MSIFYHNPEVQLLLAIEFVNSSLTAGVNKRDILIKLGEKKDGQVSSISKSIVKRSQDVGVEAAISNAFIMDATIKEFFSAFGLQQGVDPRPILSSLSSRIIKERDMNAPEKISSISSSMHRIIFVMMLPIIIFVASFVQDALNEFIQLQLRPLADFIVYLVVAFVILFTITFMRKP